MKNFTSNKNLSTVRSLITGLLMALLFGSLMASATGSAEVGLGMAAFSFLGGITIALGFTKSERRAMSFMACGTITADIEIDCDPLTGGVAPTFYIANKDDILSSTLDTNPMLLEDITMKPTKNFFTIEGQLKSFEPKFTMVKGTYINQYEHEVAFLVFDISAATKQQILAMKDGSFVVIAENNHTGTTGESKYEVYGLGGGLRAEIQERTPQDAETLGAFKITLKTQEYAREGKPPLTLFDTDAATTATLITTLLTPAP